MLPITSNPFYCHRSTFVFIDSYYLYNITFINYFLVCYTTYYRLVKRSTTTGLFDDLRFDGRPYLYGKKLEITGRYQINFDGQLQLMVGSDLKTLSTLRITRQIHQTTPGIIIKYRWPGTDEREHSMLLSGKSSKPLEGGVHLMVKLEVQRLNQGKRNT